MRTTCNVIVAILLLATTPIVSAAPYGSNDLVVPVVGRGEGANGSVWITDLIISNTSPRPVAGPVTVTLLQSGSPPRRFTFDLAPRQSRTFRDILAERFSITAGQGLLLVEAADASATLTARARIINRGGSIGEFGQTIPAIPRSLLGSDAWVTGLTGVGGHRANAGISNPNGHDATVFLALYDREGEMRSGFATIVAAGSVRQWNDIFPHFNVEPLEDATLHVTASLPVYAYGSVIRNDSGDPSYLGGTSGRSGSSLVITPACASPAPLFLAPAGSVPATGWLVRLREAIDPRAEGSRLSSIYPLSILAYYDVLPGFWADLTPQTIADLRCEPTVTSIQQNAGWQFP